jgi:phosphatidylserine/phosphatidylglycerophosphate/cardiolipin synthase-like enzyme
MKSLTISEGFRKAIGDRKIIHAFFSTYSFEPSFFELEVVPLLLGSPALSSNETIRYVQLQDLTRKMHHRFAVAYDYDVFDPELATKLEIDYLPVRVANGCQHAKIAVLEVENGGKDASSIILAAGSFNLTKAGWWENIEVGHWIELTDDFAPANVAGPLKRALDYFERRQPSPVLGALRERLESFVETRDDAECSFYFSGSGPNRVHFTDFLWQKRGLGRGTLEIVSPFFAEDGKDDVISGFFSKFESVSLLLPRDENDTALIDPGVHQDLTHLGVRWCRWRSALAEEYEVPAKNGIPRKLHAKIYQASGATPWVFIGSVNLSNKAFRSNTESGFLLLRKPWVSLLAEDRTEPNDFMPSMEAEPVVQQENARMPVLRLTYDWQFDELHLLCTHAGELALLDVAGNVLSRFDLEPGKARTEKAPGLKGHLERSALVDAQWKDRDGEGVARRTLLVSQRNVFCRPSLLPAMDLQDLLRIFQGMQSARRTELIGLLAARMIRLGNTSSAVADQHLPPLPSALIPASFFSEFSQVNGAFWKLKKHLASAEKLNDFNTLHYYLHGCQPDSLRGVLDSLQPAEGRTVPSLIVRYLTLLSIDEVLDLHSSYAEPALKGQVQACITEAEGESGFDGIPDRDRFLSFIKQKFRMPVKGIIRNSMNSGVPNAAN